MKKLRVIGYCRESTMGQFEEGFNIDDQEKKIKQYVEIYYCDRVYHLDIKKEGASAKSLDRPMMNEIIAMAKKREFDVLIVHNLDRMTRRVRDLAVLLDLFEKKGIQLISITEKIDTETPMGRFFIYLIVLIAQWEQETISSRTTRGLHESARQGNYCKPYVPYGYRRDPENKRHLIVDDEEAEVVRWIFKNRSLMKGASRIRLELKTHFPEVNLNRQQIDKILNNRIYYGTMELHGQLYDNVAPPIVSYLEYMKANDAMTRHSNSRWHLLKGKAVCENCSRTLRLSVFVQDGREYRYYRCNQCGKQINETLIQKKLNEKLIPRGHDKPFLRMDYYEQREEVIKRVESVSVDFTLKKEDRVHITMKQ